MTDTDLVDGMRAGDRRALETLYDRHAAALLGLAVRMLGDRGEAEDLVHDVFVEAWRSAASFDPARAKVGTWLVVRLRSRAIDRLRRRAIDPSRATAAGAPAVDLREAVEHAPAEEGGGPGRELDRRRALAALDALPDEQRTVVELAYFHGLSFRELAEACSIPVSTAKSRMTAAIRTLREKLKTGETPE